MTRESDVYENLRVTVTVTEFDNAVRRPVDTISAEDVKHLLLSSTHQRRK
jgi:hypothetical protein